VREMRGLWEILRRIRKLAERGEEAALATVIATSGSTYRRPGARMLITPEEAVGAVSAGCLEEEVRTVGLQVIERGRPERLCFDTTEEMDKLAGTGLGCRGVIDIFIEPLSPERADVYLKMHQFLQEDCPCTLVLETKTGGHALLVQEELQLDEINDPDLLKNIRRAVESLSARRPTALLRHRGHEVYVERLEPPLKLIVCGAGYDAQPLAKLAEELGFHVTVVDPRPAYLTEERFPWAERLVLAHPDELSEKLPWAVDERTAIVVMTHHYERDKGFLVWALSSRAFYVGQMGPRARTEELLADIARELGYLPEAAQGKLYAPVGLDVGAETPEEIALSILSEILAVRSGRSGKPLKECQGPIHE